MHNSGKDSPTLTSGPSSALPTDYGVFTLRSYTHRGITHAAMTLGNPSTAKEPPLVRVHSECLTGDALGSHRCDCGDQLSASLAAISNNGDGILIYLRGQEGRGIGLENKLRAYALQDQGLDNVKANQALGLPDDARTYEAAAEILFELECPRVRLLSSNPSKDEALSRLGICVVQRLSLQVPDRSENSAYLSSKRLQMNHDIPKGRRLSEDSGHLDVYDTIASNNEVVAQLAQSQDGFIAARTGDAQFVSGQLDRTHLHRIRAVVGAVVVGAGTVITDDPQLTVRAVEGQNPVRVVIDPHGRIPSTAKVLQSPFAPTLWLVGAELQTSSDVGEHVRVVRLPQNDSDEWTSPDTIISMIREYVSGSILIEGGGRTVSKFLSATALDRLFLTTAPVLIGDGVPGIRFRGSPVMAKAMRTPFRRYDFGEDVCIEYVLNQTALNRSAEQPSG